MFNQKTQIIGAIPFASGGGGEAGALSGLTIDADKNWLHHDITDIGKITASRSDTPSGDFIHPVLLASYTVDIPNNHVVVGGQANVANTGNNDMSGGAHGIGFLGLITDNENAKIDLYGVEGRVNGQSTQLGVTYRGVLGLAHFSGNSFQGMMYGLEARAECYEADDSTPLNEGLGIGLFIPAIIGYAGKYGLYSKEAIRVDSNLFIYDSTGTNLGMIYKGLAGDLVIDSDNDVVNFTDNSIATTGKVKTGELYIGLYVQGTEPTISDDGYMVIWINSDDSYRTYLVFRRGTGDQIKVELT